MSKLAEMQARFQQRQMQEKEEKLLKLYENQQQRAFERVSRGSAGSNTSVGSTGGGKVRQMFDERRQKAGIDKSYPLEPLKSKTNSRGGSMDRKSNVTTTSRTTVRSTVQKSVSSVRNGKPIVSKREVVHSIYNNNDGDESYEEHRYQDDNDILNANNDSGIIDMMNSHNINDGLDDEVMPQIGFDEVDNVLLSPRDAEVVPRSMQNGVTKKIETRPSLRANGVTPTKKESSPAVRKPVRVTPAKLSPATPSPAAVKSPRNPTPTSPSKTPSATMSGKAKSATRAPASNRPSAKQPAKTGVARDDLMECNFCGRRFTSDRLPKHEDICSKTGKKKRKAYDATKHRVVGTELETYVLRGPKNKSAASNRPWKHGDQPSRQEIIPKSKQTGPKKDWRKTHEEFIAAIRAAKQTQAHLAKGGKLSDLPPPPPSSNPDYVQCPHCGRRFNQAAAERHIPKCANFQFNKPKPKTVGKR